MRRASRLLPQLSKKPVPLRVWILLTMLAVGLLFVSWQHPLLTGGFALLVCGFSVGNFVIVRRHLRRLAADRADEDIGVFAKQFNCRSVDTWVIRAVYEELQEYLHPEVSAFPLHASDRLAEDLRVDQGDLEDVVASRVAERTGRSNEAAPTNPYCAKVRTVGDLVRFFNAQPHAAKT